MPKSKHLFQIKKTNASARAVEKAKTCDDFDWEKLIRTNELENLYISQLDLYLMANFNLSRKDCENNGFTKVSKIENIKKHFYSSMNQRKRYEACSTSGNSCGPASDWTNQRSTYCTPSSGSLGWYITVLHQGQVNLVNTCPIDNFLTIFYVLRPVTSSSSIY